MRRGPGSPGLFAFLLVLALIAATAGYVMAEEERALSAATSGEIVSGETDDLASGAERCDASVVYEVDGREWRTTGLAPGPCPADGGSETIEVRYDPGSPYGGKLGDPDQGPLGVAIAAALAALLLAVLLVRSVLAGRRSEEDGVAPRSSSTAPTGMYDDPPRS
ncbi:hypothetical protein [Nocardioides sp. AX2bis]|uniref:hypothetical protein n=1 Tax=Nocardioides sp. AX2bis TaxID=2653157 RepID=UPI0012F29D39|nr:hypothetical protein [Nocardioides sp. AX2bis]VXC55726.1 exported hypothetical protein [Nocardioides sp. AX2bis]